MSDRDSEPDSPRDGSDGDDKDEKKTKKRGGGDDDDGDDDDDDEKGAAAEDDDDEEVDGEHSLAEDLKSFCKGDAKKPDKFCDVTFVVGERGVQYHAHRIILAMSSPVFAAMLFPNPAFDGKDGGDGATAAGAKPDAKPEAGAKPESKRDDVLRVVMREADAFSFGLLLKCVYTDSVDVDVNRVGEVMQIANRCTHHTAQLTVQCVHTKKTRTNALLCSLLLFSVGPLNRLCG
jgi:hypothetical protein